MHPFEELMRELSHFLDVTLRPDSHQACLIQFPQDEISIQIDLDTHGDRILLGTQLGRITPGTYRMQILQQAMRTNGTLESPKGILAFSEKNDSLILFQFLNLDWLNGEKLYQFLQLFLEHAKIWKKALSTGDLPHFQDDVQVTGNKMFGL